MLELGIGLWVRNTVR